MTRFKVFSAILMVGVILYLASYISTTRVYPSKTWELQRKGYVPVTAVMAPDADHADQALVTIGENQNELLRMTIEIKKENDLTI